MKIDYKEYIKSIKDFPIEGVLFRDITTLMASGEAFKQACDDLTDFSKEAKADLVAGPEARGFMFCCPVAANLGAGFIPIRKPGKLPRETVSVSYELEYGKNELCVHKDAIKPGQRVVIIDDLLATGGTIKAAAELVESLGGIVAGLFFVIELTDLKGRELLKGYNVKSLVQY